MTELQKAIRKHVLECVQDYDENDFKTFDDAAKHMQKEFNRVANYPYNLQRFPDEAERFSDYLNGLPFGFYFYYHDIQDFLRSIGFGDASIQDNGTAATKAYHLLIYSEMKRV